MKIISIETFHCDAGWRPWTFIKITTDEGLVGWSECTDSHGSPLGLEGIIKDLSPLLIGQDPRLTEKLYWQLYSRTRQSPGSIIQKAIGGIENALLDIKAKALDIPVYELFGGPIRDELPLYWSHCGTTRVRAADVVGEKQIKSLDDVTAFGKEIKKSGYKVIKTNIPVFDDKPFVYMPGFFKSGGGPELNPTREIIDAADKYVGALRKSVGDKIDIIVDLNFNFKTEGYIKMAKELEKYNLFWLEIDSYDAKALRYIREKINISVCSGENLYGTRGFRPYFEEHSMDVASVDVIWNGLVQSKKIADMAELYEINVTTHNYYSHLADYISAHFCAIVPNMRIMEIDIDDVPWKKELIINPPKIKDGKFNIPKGPGWGSDINEKVLHEHPWPKQ